MSDGRAATTAEAPNANIAARLLERAERHPERAAFLAWRGGRPERVGFGELARRMVAFSRELRRRGARPGDRVLVFVPMSIELYVALLGIHHAGAVAVFVDAWADRRRLEAAVAAAGPRAFVGTPRAHLLRLASRAVRAIPIHLVVRHGLGGAGDGGREPAASLGPEAPALVTFTTGTTGKPKAAARSHGFLWAQHQVLAAHLAPREDDVDMPTLPVFVLHNLAGGVTSVLPDMDPRRPAEIRPAAVLAQMRDARATTAGGSPAFFERLCDHVAATGATLPLRTFFTGGAPVPPSLARRFAACCAPAEVLYGSTEAEPIASIPAAELARRTHPGAPGLCAGFPIPEIELRIVRPVDGPLVLGPAGWDEWRIDPAAPGEILVSGPHVLRGYWNDPEADRENKVRDGGRVWHRTGDGGVLDAEGRLWLTGRVKHRVARAGGTWWGLPVELRVLGIAGVRQAAYVGVADASLGQRAVLCVEAAEDARRRDSLIAAAAPAPVDQIVFMERIPRDPRHASKTDVDALRLRLTGRG